MLSFSERKSLSRLAHEHDSLPAQPGDLRAWHNPQVGGSPSFHRKVASLEEARTLLDALAAYDAFQLVHQIKGDYANIQGVEIYEDNGEGGLDWFDWNDPDTGESFDEWRRSQDDMKAA